MQVHEIEDFDELLEGAELEAVTDWEMQFVSSIKTKYLQYSEATFISKAQLTQLEKIVRMR